MTRKCALIIANTEYSDPGLAQLNAPSKDAEEFARVLRSADICAFDEVKVLLNEDESIVSRTIEAFLNNGKPSDLLLIYFSGHGMRDEKGDLYLAVKNTTHNQLRSTAIKSDFIRDGMDSCRSKRQVLILDCCYSGAYARTKALTTDRAVTLSTFKGTGEGRIVLTASDSTQFAWQGDKIIGKMENSLFTNFLVRGLEGEADLDEDGRISIDELYDYAYEKVTALTTNQTPVKWASEQHGEVILRDNVQPPIPLPKDLIVAITSPIIDTRLQAVKQLEALVTNKNSKLISSARKALEHMAAEDDSRRVILAASKVLGYEEPPREVSTVEQKRISELSQKNAELQIQLRKSQQRGVFGITIAVIFTVIFAGMAVLLRPFLVGITASTPTPTQNVLTATAPVIAPPVRDTATPTETDSTSTPTLTATVTPTLTITATATGTSDVFIDNKGVVMKLVPASNFIMGSNNADPDEAPSHSVYLSAYYIDQFEVTNQQYEACVNDGVCKPPGQADAPPHKNYYGNPIYSDYPVVYVNWNMATLFCTWRDASLPTEAQWEKAARGTDARIYPWGKDVDCQRVNYHSGDNSCPNGTTRAGNYKIGESRYGVYDLAGNVWEWVFDWYSADYYKSFPSFNPTGPEAGQARVLRGGSWSDDEWAIRSSNRLRYAPGYSNFNTGFRCAREVENP